MEKLYIVTRADLAPGAQIAQSAHALSAFAFAFPDEHRRWHGGSNNLVVVAVPSVGDLERLRRRADDTDDIAIVAFYEPDFGDQLTSIALYGAEAGKLVSSLPLALRAPKAA
jgi:hypothetical protein